MESSFKEASIFYVIVCPALLMCRAGFGLLSGELFYHILEGAEKMKRKGLGGVLLGIWLIARELLPYLTFTIPYWETIMSILAVAAGILILLER